MDANKSQFLIMQTLFKMYRYRHRPFPSYQQWSDPEPPRWRKFAECVEERDWDAFDKTADSERSNINIGIHLIFFFLFQQMISNYGKRRHLAGRPTCGGGCFTLPRSRLSTCMRQVPQAASCKPKTSRLDILP